jgi:ATP-dependent DNA helicase RecG
MEAMAERAFEAPTNEVPRAFATGDRQDRDSLLAVALRSVPRPSLLGAPVSALRGAGPRVAEAAAEMGIACVGDLLDRVPHNYRNGSAPRPVAELRIGEPATVRVEVKSARLIRVRRRRLTILEAAVRDESGPLKVIWFNQRYLADRLEPGTRLLLQGKLERRGFTVSEHEILGAGGGTPEGLHTTGLVPVHPASEALRARRLRELTWQAVDLCTNAIEPLPAALRVRRGLAGTADSLRAAHFPERPDEAQAARHRLAFEELLLHQAALATRRHERKVTLSAPELAPPGPLTAGWLDSLPFELTADQLRALDEVDADLGADQPMQRLLMGEVGSGKTIVAAYAMLRAVESGRQAALMAPTETLAEQHFRTLADLLDGSGLDLALLTSSRRPEERARAFAGLARGDLSLVVGTHALIEPEVRFAQLAVAVVDEQHRFGVGQRAALDRKGPAAMAPHTLHMTATPIPRTLSLTAYGDLDVTAVRELPRGRQPVETKVVGEGGRAGAYGFIAEQLREGRQAYVVCPLVSESEKLDARAAEEEAARLRQGELRDFALEVLHGQLRTDLKQRAMRRFVDGEAQVLVATSVIEVGIDVPNATVMAIESADRYGLTQLHQLRGRVGRGAHRSTCILFAEPRSETARARLRAIATESDGFKLAEIDLALRGEGEILGTRQHGLPRFRVASLPDDLELLLATREEVSSMIARHGGLGAPDLGPLAEAVRRRFGDEGLPIAA